MVAILYLEVKLLRKNSKQYHTRQNARKPRKTAKNKQRLTGAKNTVKPLINRVIQQPRWRRNTTNRQTRHRAPHGGNRTATARSHAKHRSSTHARHTMQPRALHASRTPHRRSRSLRTHPPTPAPAQRNHHPHLCQADNPHPSRPHKSKSAAPPHNRDGTAPHAHTNQVSGRA